MHTCIYRIHICIHICIYMCICIFIRILPKTRCHRLTCSCRFLLGSFEFSSLQAERIKSPTPIQVIGTCVWKLFRSGAQSKKSAVILSLSPTRADLGPKWASRFEGPQCLVPRNSKHLPGDRRKPCECCCRIVSSSAQGWPQKWER